jgi:hypothetical protein
MGEDLDVMTYMMAAEKMGNLLHTIESTMSFMLEYKVEPDDEVKKALSPMIEVIRKWLDGK